MGPMARPGGSRVRLGRARTRASSLALVTAAGVVALAACSSGSSQPGYCSDRTNLENSIKGLTSLNASSGVSGLKTQLSKIQTDATSLVNSAKGDFPSQTSAITSSLDALKTSVTTLSASPSAAQIATVTKDAGKLVSSVTSFMNASSSKCS
jgi:hypothetical protein